MIYLQSMAIIGTINFDWDRCVGTIHFDWDVFHEIDLSIITSRP